MGLLDGKVAFITGAASGIGKATALRFAGEGAKIGLADNLREQGEQAQREIERAGEVYSMRCVRPPCC